MLILIIKLLICFVLFQSAWHKIQNPTYVINALTQYEISSIKISQKQMQTFGILELLLLILWHIAALSALISLLIFGLFTAYTFMLYLVYRKGIRGIACGCSGPAVQLEIGKAIIFRNLFYLLMIFGVIWQSETIADPYLLVAFPISLSLFLLHNACEQLISNRNLIVKIEKFS